MPVAIDTMCTCNCLTIVANCINCYVEVVPIVYFALRAVEPMLEPIVVVRSYTHPTQLYLVESTMS
jgi:hypothetical protein